MLDSSPENQLEIRCQIVHCDDQCRSFKYLSHSNFCEEFQKSYLKLFGNFHPLINMMVYKDDFFRPFTLPHLLKKPEKTKYDLLQDFKRMSVNFFFSSEPEKIDDHLNSFGINFCQASPLTKEEWNKIIYYWFNSRYYENILFFKHYYEKIITASKDDKKVSYLITESSLDKTDNDDGKLKSEFNNIFSSRYDIKIKTFDEIAFRKGHIRPLFNNYCLKLIESGQLKNPFIKRLLFMAYAEYIVYSDYDYHFIVPHESTDILAYWTVSVKKACIKSRQAVFIERMSKFLNEIGRKINSQDIAITKKHIGLNFLHKISIPDMKEIVSIYSKYQELKKPKKISNIVILRNYTKIHKEKDYTINTINFYFSENDYTDYRELILALKKKIEIELPITYTFDEDEYEKLLAIDDPNEKGEQFERFIKYMLIEMELLSFDYHDDEVDMEFLEYFRKIHKKNPDLILCRLNPIGTIVCEIKSSLKKYEATKGMNYLKSILFDENNNLDRLLNSDYRNEGTKMLGLKTILFCNCDTTKNKENSSGELHVFTKKDLVVPETIYNKILKLIF